MILGAPIYGNDDSYERLVNRVTGENKWEIRREKEKISHEGNTIDRPIEEKAVRG